MIIILIMQGGTRMEFPIFKLFCLFISAVCAVDFIVSRDEHKMSQALLWLVICSLEG